MKLNLVTAGLKTLGRRPDPSTPRCPRCRRYLTLSVERERNVCVECYSPKWGRP